MGYLFEHDGKVYSPEGETTATNIAAHNAELEATELKIWNDQPHAMVLYVNDRDQITTWLGTVLGAISSGHSVRNNLGARIRYIRVNGTNGARYYGKYGADSTQAVRLRRMKCR